MRAIAGVALNVANENSLVAVYLAVGSPGVVRGAGFEAVATGHWLEFEAL